MYLLQNVLMHLSTRKSEGAGAMDEDKPICPTWNSETTLMWKN